MYLLVITVFVLVVIVGTSPSQCPSSFASSFLLRLPAIQLLAGDLLLVWGTVGSGLVRSPLPPPLRNTCDISTRLEYPHCCVLFSMLAVLYFSLTPASCDVLGKSSFVAAILGELGPSCDGGRMAVHGEGRVMSVDG
jgi:hypothetical protein